jgi:hypothetical protein
MGTGDISWGKYGRGLLLTTHPLTVPWVRKEGVCTSLPPVRHNWHVTGNFCLFYCDDIYQRIICCYQVKGRSATVRAEVCLLLQGIFNIPFNLINSHFNLTSTFKFYICNCIIFGGQIIVHDYRELFENCFSSPELTALTLVYTFTNEFNPLKPKLV